MFVNYKSTFNLPNFHGRYLKQGTSGTYGNESLPNISGGIHVIDRSIGSPFPTGAIYSNIETTNWASWATESTKVAGNFIFDASRSSSTYQDNAKVNPDNAEILYCIKY